MRSGMRMALRVAAGWLVGWSLTGCSSVNGPPATVPHFETASFSDPVKIDNPYFPLSVGEAKLFFRQTAENDQTIREVIVVETLDRTREVAGVTTRVLRDRVFVSGLLVEDTHDWYAQDDQGNVWYLGEEVDNYEYDDSDNIVSIDHQGAWEAGKDVAGVGSAAKPGYVMLGHPEVGSIYHQEWYPGEAEDAGEVLDLAKAIELADGRSYATLMTRDFSTLDPDIDGNKYYLHGQGVIAETDQGAPGRLEHAGTFDRRAGAPLFDPENFPDPTRITHPFMPWSPGSVSTYESETEDGREKSVVEVLSGSREVNGIDCVVVRDRVYLEGLLIEDTRDWYAQDKDGKVWHLGEEVDNYNYDDEGRLIDITHEGAWEAGKDIAGIGSIAQAGIVMQADPASKIRHSYSHEVYEGEAEDMGMIVRTDARVELADGSVYQNCLQVLEWNPAGPGGLAYAFYASGVGAVLEVELNVGERLELIERMP